MGSQLVLLLTGASLGLSFALAAMVLRDPVLRPAPRRLVLVIVAGGAAFSLHGTELPGVSSAAVALRIASLAGLVAFWQLVRYLFSDARDDRAAWWVAAALAVLLGLSAWIPGPDAAGRMAWWLAAGLTLHALWLLAAGWRADLDEFRRQSRPGWLLVGSLYVLAVLIAQAAGLRVPGDPSGTTAWLLAQLALKCGWMWITLGAPSPLDRLQPTEAGDPALASTPAPDPATSVTEALLRQQGALVIDAMVSARLYRQSRLSVASLADHLRLPEHRVRLVINKHLGFRNFNAFLNHWRLAEVAARLGDPADAHLPVLTLALEAGFGSIGPFNRAFRDAFGTTPTAYRRSPPQPQGRPMLAES